MRSIHSILTDLKATSSRKSKIEILESIDDDTGGRVALEVLEYALNPFKTYGILSSKFDAPTPELDADFVSRFSDLKVFLDDLVARKITGNNAKDKAREWYNIESVSPILQRILSKDLRSGMGRGTFNVALPGSVPRFDVCLAKPYKERWAKYPGWAEPKLDGVRANTIIGYDGEVRICSRNGKTLNNFPNIKASIEALDLRGCVLDGEVAGKNFDRVMSVTHRKTGLDDRDLEYQLFDRIPLKDFESMTNNETLQERRSSLLSIVLGNQNYNPDHVKIVRGRSVEDRDELDEYYEECLAAGYEGVMLKDPSATYQFKRNKCWLKVKPEETYDGVIVGYYEGKKDLAGNFGGFVVNIDGVETRCGGGFSAELRRSIWDNPDKYLGNHIEVGGQELTKDGVVRFPKKRRFREDKD